MLSLAQPETPLFKCATDIITITSTVRNTNPIDGATTVGTVLSIILITLGSPDRSLVNVNVSA